MPAWQVPRTCKGWIQLGKKLAPYNVKANKLFKAEQAFFLLMWCGGPTEADCKVLSCINYKRMNAKVGFDMCAARLQMLFATLRVHSEYGNIALHDLWFGRSILPLLCCLITSKCVVDFGWLGKSSQYCWA